MGLLSWIIFGLLAGALAKLVTPGNDPKGCLITIAVGIAGAAIGGWIGTRLGIGTVNSFDVRSILLAVLGASLLLLLLRALAGPRRI